MANKKKTTSKAKKAAASEEPVAEGPATPSPQQTQSSKDFTRAQITTLVFFAVGASRLVEWSNAASEMADIEAGINGTAAKCQSYMKSDDEVNFESVCSDPVTHTMTILKYDISFQMLVVVAFMMAQCWRDEIMLSRVNAVLTMTPISTTLLLLQACSAWIDTRRSKMLTITSGILMFLALPATGEVMREFRESSHKRVSSGLFVTLSLVIMAAMYLFEAWQWSETSKQSGVDHVLPADTLANWNEAWKVFMSMLVYDKCSMAALLGSVLVFFDEARQRRFLLVFALVKFHEYSFTLPYYPEGKFADLENMRFMALASTVLAGVAWIAPTVSLGGNDSTPTAPQAPKIKAV